MMPRLTVVFSPFKSFVLFLNKLKELRFLPCEMIFLFCFLWLISFFENKNRLNALIFLTQCAKFFTFFNVNKV